MPTTIFVPGIARPQGSHSAKVLRRHDGTPYAQVFPVSDAALRAWRKNIVTAASMNFRETLERVPVATRMEFLVSSPKNRKFPWPITRPDLDKLARAANDALRDAGVYADDSQITQSTLSKAYAPEGTPPGLRVTVASALDALQPELFEEEHECRCERCGRTM